MTQRPSVTYAWYTVVLLTLAYTCAFVDRYILGLLVEPIKAEFELSDFQISILLGPAFAAFYATMGLPMGWLADRGRRTLLVGAGIFIWSLATAASGLAKSYVQLLAARLSVGAGEATLAPCALSMIADSFDEEHRGKPVAFYSAAQSVGSGIAYLAGASVLAWSTRQAAINVPMLGTIAPWQFTFMIVGVAGLPLALLILTLREPPRVERHELPGQDLTGMWDTFLYIFGRLRLFAGFIGLVCVMTMVAYSQGWLPAMFTRTWGWPAEKYALYNGLSLVILGPASLATAGILADRWMKAGRRDAPISLVIAGVVILVLTGIAAPLMPTAWAAFATYQLNTVGIAITSATAATALLNITPAAIRGKLIAIYYLLISLTGLFLGPTSVGLLSDYVLGEENIRYAMAILPAVVGIPVLLTALGTRREYLKEVNAP